MANVAAVISSIRNIIRQEREISMENLGKRPRRHYKEKFLLLN